MTAQAATLSARAADLRAQFLARFGFRLNARVGAGSMRGCLLLTVPVFRDSETADHAQLSAIGAWLEAAGYYYAHDFQRVGQLSAANGWACWNGGVSVSVRYRPKG